MSRASRTGVRGLFLAADGTYRVDLRYRTSNGRHRRFAKRLPPGTTAAAAKRHALHLLNAALDGTIDQLAPNRRSTLAAALRTLWLEAFETTDERRASLIASIIKTIGDVRLDRFDAQHMHALIAKRRAEGCKAATINRSLAALKVMAKRASQRGWLVSAVAEAIRAVPLLREDNVRVFTHTPAELQRVVNHSSPALQKMIAAAMLTGMRRGELVALRREDIDLDKRVIIARRTKTKTVTTIPVPEALLPALDGSGVYVFQTAAGGPYTPAAVTRAFARACARAKVEGLRWHDLRHLYASMLHSRGVDIGLLATLLGHSSRTGTAITRRYAHATEDAHERVRQLLADGGGVDIAVGKPLANLMSKTQTKSTQRTTRRLIKSAIKGEK